MILLIDNYDSFVYNLARYVGKLGRARDVVRNDAVTIPDIENLNPAAIILSPGPCTPKDAGISKAIVKRFSGHIPLLGVCLGHQCIGEEFGGRTVLSSAPCHGKTSIIEHDEEGLFMGLPNPMSGARYHSLVVDLASNSPLQVTARTHDDKIVMAVKHCDYPVYGLQFHPESVMTPYGFDIIRNFTALADQWNETYHKEIA